MLVLIVMKEPVAQCVQQWSFIAQRNRPYQALSLLIIRVSRIVDFGPGFFDNVRNTDYHQTHPLNIVFCEKKQ